MLAKLVGSFLKFVVCTELLIVKGMWAFIAAAAPLAHQQFFVILEVKSNICLELGCPLSGGFSILPSVCFQQSF